MCASLSACVGVADAASAPVAHRASVTVTPAGACVPLTLIVTLPSAVVHSTSVDASSVCSACTLTPTSEYFFIISGLNMSFAIFICERGREAREREVATTQELRASAVWQLQHLLHEARPLLVAAAAAAAAEHHPRGRRAAARHARRHRRRERAGAREERGDDHRDGGVEEGGARATRSSRSTR